MNKDIEKSYVFLIDTLNLILLPKKVEGVSYLAEIEDRLTELEGDYYTFLNRINIEKLANNNLIKSDLVGVIDGIWEQINAIDSLLWNPVDFIESSEWQDVRSKVTNLFMKEAL